MNILWLDLVSELGGAQRSMLEVCQALSANGVNVTAAVPYGPLFDLLKETGVPVYPVSAIRATKRGWNFFVTTAKLLRAPSTIRQIVRVVKPDIVHANSLPAFLAASRSVNHIPLFWHVRDIKLPSVVAHEAAKKADRIIAASQAIDEHLVEILSPRILGRIRVICNGIDPARFSKGNRAEARERLGIPLNVPVVGMIAHIVPWKRHDAFISAAALIRKQRPDAQFVAVGRDLFGEHARYFAELEAQIKQEGLVDCFKWIKNIDAPEAILPAFDVLLHPPLQEPFGRVICEAMAARVPVVAAESAGPATIIAQRESGILVREGAPHDLAREVLALLADPERVSRLTEEAHRVVSAQFTVQHVCEQLTQEYQSVLAAHRADNAPRKDDD